jgi:capsular polysaccharide biosynthesis protein
MTISNPELPNRPASPPPDNWLPEDEIDLRQYVLVLVAWWREIALIAIGAAVVAAVAILLLRLVTPPTYASSATVAIARTQSSITFDERFTTLSQDQLQALSSVDAAARRGALLGLVSNGAVAQAVIAQLSNILTDENEQSPAYWLAEGQVKAELVGSTGSQANSDLIRITISADSPAKAAALANAWAQNYVEQVNRIYGQIPSELVASVTSELGKAQAEYDSAQTELEAFVAQNEVDKLNRLIVEKQDIIASLQAGKQTAITTIVDEELQARRQIISAYIAAQASNRLLTFTKEQEAKQRLVSALIDADTEGRLHALASEQSAKTQLFDAYANTETQSKLAVVNQQTQSRIDQLATYYGTRAKLTQLLDNAKVLRDQAAQAGDTSTTTNGLALLLLKAQVYASSVGLPGNLQITLGSIADISTDAQAQVADVDALIQVLEQRLSALDAAIAAQSQALLTNADYQFLDPTGLGAVAGAGSPLATTILAQYDELFTLGPLAQASATISTTTPLFAAIREQYPDLFRVGELAGLTDLVAMDNPLTVLGTERAKELLQLQGLEDLPAYTAAAEPLTQAIDQLESDIQALQARQEAESSRRQQLAQRRDLAWSTLTTLKNKNAELNLSAVTVNSEVRLAAPAVEPIRPVAGQGLMTTTALAGIVGLMLAVFVVFFANFMGGQPWLAANGGR